ncbi:TIGR04222 domain-containing membrane protein [Yinghuangia seranimata]|uniref:TIGR04222 domain-containing membrane protein n=1 Tax=Yinghuangia seranimata TaxID=408067 RepID=UPI00248D352E|nr:TIGR04222 domain-containing membrane protein [Yinghuangia seranimata]MDI2126603.1 TIGR04222 domain-containing membrane protein [Yinghuangia seranimata]
MVWLIVSVVLFAAVGVYARGVMKAGKARRVVAPETGSLDLYHLAFLAGGPGRAADVALLAARARGEVQIAPDGRIAPGQGAGGGDMYGAAVDAAVRGAGGNATVAGARVVVAGHGSIRALRDRLFQQGLLNPAKHTANLGTVRLALWIAPLVAIAGLFIKPLAGSPTHHTGLWIGNLALVLLGTLGCATMLFFLFTRYDKLQSPLNDQSMFYLWNQVRDPQQLQHISQAVPGGPGLGEVALFGLDRIQDPALRGVFTQAVQVTAGQITSDGWNEQQWRQAAESRGPLGAPSYNDVRYAAQQQAQNPGQAPGQVPGQQGGYPQQPGQQTAYPTPGQALPNHGMYGGGAQAYQDPVRAPWEDQPGQH